MSTTKSRGIKSHWRSWLSLWCIAKSPDDDEPCKPSSSVDISVSDQSELTLIGKSKSNELRIRVDKEFTCQFNTIEIRLQSARPSTAPLRMESDINSGFGCNNKRSASTRSKSVANVSPPGSSPVKPNQVGLEPRSHEPGPILSPDKLRLLESSLSYSPERKTSNRRSHISEAVIEYHVPADYQADSEEGMAGSYPDPFTKSPKARARRKPPLSASLVRFNNLNSVASPTATMSPVASKSPTEFSALEYERHFSPMSFHFPRKSVGENTHKTNYTLHKNKSCPSLRPICTDQITSDMPPLSPPLSTMLRPPPQRKPASRPSTRGSIKSVASIDSPKDSVILDFCPSVANYATSRSALGATSHDRPYSYCLTTTSNDWFVNDNANPSSRLPRKTSTINANEQDAPQTFICDKTPRTFFLGEVEGSK